MIALFVPSQLTPFHLRFCKRYGEIGSIMKHAVQMYSDEVRNGDFPQPQHCYPMSDSETKQFLANVEILSSSRLPTNSLDDERRMRQI
jgi:hypothetical protein